MIKTTFGVIKHSIGMIKTTFGVINRFDAVSAYMRKMDHYGLSDF